MILVVIYRKSEYLRGGTPLPPCIYHWSDKTAKNIPNVLLNGPKSANFVKGMTIHSY